MYALLQYPWLVAFHFRWQFFRGLLCLSVLRAQTASPTFTHVYAAVMAVINSKFPQIGELLLQRLILQFRRSYRRNDKNVCLTASQFIAHLVNQQVVSLACGRYFIFNRLLLQRLSIEISSVILVPYKECSWFFINNQAHEIVALELLTLLLEKASDDSVEIAVGFLKEVGMKLTDVSPRGINAIFDRMRNVLHEAKVELRVQYMIEVSTTSRYRQAQRLRIIVLPVSFPCLVRDLVFGM